VWVLGLAGACFLVSPGSAVVVSHAARVVEGCEPGDFAERSGDALLRQVREASPGCVGTLFGLKGDVAHRVFRESQMVTVAQALRDDVVGYEGDNRAHTVQLVLFLRAGYYVQWYHSGDVGAYGAALRTAVRAALDAFFGNSKSAVVSDANGEVLAEAVTLVDSAQENARYLYVVERLLDGYDSSYDRYRSMLDAVNNVYQVLFRGHQSPEFVSAVEADSRVLDSLESFASGPLGLLGTDRGALTSNAGRELGRFLQHESLQPTVRPMLKGLLGKSSMTGRTARLWVGVAEMTDHYDRADCDYYGTCDLKARLERAVLPVDRTCGAAVRIRAQDMTDAQVSDTCASLKKQEAHFHGLVKDGDKPVANDNNATVEICVFDSSADYQTYAGVMFGIETDNGGMYLEGDPAAPGNQARFIAHEAEWARPEFQIRNLHHEYAHYLDGRFDLYGGYDVSTPTFWWVEGFAEYASYSYRKVTNHSAIAEAAKKTYALSTLWNTSPGDDGARIYSWGYLAVRYMFEEHPDDIAALLGYYRAGKWDAARTLLTTIGSHYDDDWRKWLGECASGGCAEPADVR
jgi:microbial collagenase